MKDLGLRSGVLLQSCFKDGRIFFILPWLGKTLIGTTEKEYSGDLNSVEVERDEIDYLLDCCNHYLRKKIDSSSIITSFAGLRWLAVDEGRSLSATSRESVIGESKSKRGCLYTIYGGKLTSYRLLSEKIGDKITNDYGDFVESKTNKKENWLDPEEDKSQEEDLQLRFK